MNRIITRIFKQVGGKSIINGGRTMSTVSVDQANEKARQDAVKALREVTSVLGKEHGKMYEEPKYDEEYIKKIVTFCDRPALDSWEIRRLMQDLCDHDAVPDPEIIKAVMRGCRKLNDFALAIRMLELVKLKCGRAYTKFLPYILQEIRPTLNELGIPTLEELGYDKPELAVIDPLDVHG